MTEEIAERAVTLSASHSDCNIGIIFFGGEPLLAFDLLAHTVSHCRELERKTGQSFHFKATTNGVLLREKMVDFAANERIHLAISIDGLGRCHDQHRRTAGGCGTFDAIRANISALLRRQPYATALMTVTPETVGDYAESVDFIFSIGFRYIVASLHYKGDWTDAHMERLREEYMKLSRWYEEKTLSEDKFYFSPFEKKLAAYIQGEEALCTRCHLGIRQVSIAPDGLVYPCVQFVQDGTSNRTFAIGDVWSGIDKGRQQELYALSREENAECLQCAIRSRCEHMCSCLNWQTTGSITRVSPVLCESERILTPIVDRLGGRLFGKRAPLFIQKHYNASYALASYIEDHLVSV